MVIDFDGEHGGCAHGPRHRDGEQSDGAAAGDGHGFGGDFTRQHSMNRVAQRIKNGGVLLRNGGIEFPDVRFWNDYIFGEGAVCIDADNLHVLADVGFAGAALQALAACHMHFGGDKVAFFHTRYFIAECGYLAAKLMPWNQWRMNAVLRPAVPVVDVQVGAADGGNLHFDRQTSLQAGRRGF